MNGGSSAPYLACTPCVPLFCTSYNRGGNRSAFRLPGAGGGSFPLYGGTFVRSYSVSRNAPNIPISDPPPPKILLWGPLLLQNKGEGATHIGNRLTIHRGLSGPQGTKPRKRSEKKSPGAKRHININFLLWLTCRWPWDKRLVVPGLTGPKSLCVRLETQEI